MIWCGYSMQVRNRYKRNKMQARWSVDLYITSSKLPAVITSLDSTLYLATRDVIAVRSCLCKILSRETQTPRSDYFPSQYIIY